MAENSRFQQMKFRAKHARRLKIYDHDKNCNCAKNLQHQQQQRAAAAGTTADFSGKIFIALASRRAYASVANLKLSERSQDLCLNRIWILLDLVLGPGAVRVPILTWAASPETLPIWKIWAAMRRGSDCCKLSWFVIQIYFWARAPSNSSNINNVVHEHTPVQDWRRVSLQFCGLAWRFTQFGRDAEI